MLILTLKARRLIDGAVNAYGSEHQRTVWRGFARAHPDIRRGPADPHEDGTGAFPPDVAEVAQSVLNQMFDAVQRRQLASQSEEDVAEFSNDLAFIRSVVRTLNRHAPRTASLNHGVAL